MPNDAIVESSTTPTLAVPDANSPQYTNWRMTGKLPEEAGDDDTPTEGEESATSQDHSAAAKAGKGAPASEAGNDNTQGKRAAKPRSDAASRLDEVLADLKEAGLTPAQLKSFKNDWARKGEQQPPAQETKKPDSPAPAGAELKPPEKPQIGEFDDPDKYQEALEKYEGDLLDFKVEKRFREREAQRAAAAAAERTRETLAKASERYGDGAGKTILDAAKELTGDKQVNGVVKALFDDSPIMADLFYVMASKSAEWQEFLKLSRESPGKAIRQLVLIEKLTSDELAKGSQATEGAATDGAAPRSEDGKFVSGKQPPARKQSTAPPPPTEAGAHSGPPRDEVEDAATSGDFGRFRSSANRRDLARRQGR